MRILSPLLVCLICAAAGAQNVDSTPSGIENFIRWIGHFHPAMTAFPIGLLLAGALAEFLRIVTKKQWLESAARYCVIVAAIGAAITAPLGWAFAVGRNHSWILETHLWLGTVGAVWLLVLWAVSETSRRRGGGWHTAYLAGLFLAVPAVSAIGFLGGAMVYGLHEYDWQPHHTMTVESVSQPNEATSTTPAEKSGQNGTVTVVMTDGMTFQPAALTVAAGTTVRWENRSKDDHTVTADPKRASDAKDVSLPTGAETFDSGKVGPGGSYSHQFSVPGTYKYVCIPHEGMGMLGQIEVKAAQ